MTQSDSVSEKPIVFGYASLNSHSGSFKMQIDSLDSFLDGCYFEKYDQLIYDAYPLESDLDFRSGLGELYKLPEGSIVAVHSIFAFGTIPQSLKIMADLVTQKQIRLLVSELGPYNDANDAELLYPYLLQNKLLVAELQANFTKDEIARFYNFSQLFLDTIVELRVGLSPARQPNSGVDLARTYANYLKTCSTRDVELALCYKRILSVPHRP